MKLIIVTPKWNSSGWETLKEMINTLSYKRNANQSFSEVSSYSRKNGQDQQNTGQGLLPRMLWKGETLYSLLGGVQPGSQWKSVGRFPKEMQIKLPQDLAIPLLDLSISPSYKPFNLQQQPACWMDWCNCGKHGMRLTNHFQILDLRPTQWDGIHTWDNAKVAKKKWRFLFLKKCCWCDCSC